MKFRTTTFAAVAVSTFISATFAYAQTQNIPFNEENWMLIGAAKFTQVDGREALQLGMSNKENPVTFGAAALKTGFLENGVIEYDLKFDNTRTFSGIQFRVASPGNGENFYLRAHRSGQPDANQYMTNYNGIPSWQLYYGAPYTKPTNYPHGEWMRIKLVVQGGLADIYIGNQDKPELTVALKRDQIKGGIGLWGLDLGGPSWISNFSIDVDSSAAVVGKPVSEASAKPGTVMSWQVSKVVDGAVLAKEVSLSDGFMNSLTFTEMNAEKTGMLNLAKLQGIAKGADTALAKITISSDLDQTKAFDFGFSDDVTVYLNGVPVFSGSDRLSSRDYRFLGTVGYNDTAWLPLKKGENTLVLAVSENVADTTGWAVQGRFRNMKGILVK